MSALENPESLPLPEVKKRKRERITIISLSLAFLFLTYIEINLASLSQKLPFVNSIFFFGLVNFNVALLLFLAFLIFRNMAKIFSERRGGMLGSRLKSKLVIAFISFAIVPTVLLFLVSVFYINSSFDKWFSLKIGSVLQDSLEVTNTFYSTTKKKNYHFANLVAERLVRTSPQKREGMLKALRKEYSLDIVEVYSGLFSKRMMASGIEADLKDVPQVTMEFLQKGLIQDVEASTIHQFSQGNLIRCIVPLKNKISQITGAVVVSSYVPLSLVSKMDVIANAFEDYRDVNPLKYPIKSIYMTILVLVTLLILFGATWFGFHLARQLSTPLEILGKATEEIAHGKYQQVDVRSGSWEVYQLVESFNKMMRDLSKSENQLRAHNRYIEVILSNISAGVVTVDQEGLITTVNKYASELLQVSGTKLLGRPFNEVLRGEHRSVLENLFSKLKQYKAHSIQKEVQVTVRGQPLVLQATLSPLRDDNGKNLGYVLVFDDMTKLINAQRAAAWREVARRIAHEIKNPLTPIRLSAERLQKKFEDQITDPAFKICTTTIIQQVDELKELVNEFSSFARLPQAQLVPNDLNNILQETLFLYQEGHKNIEFKLSLDPNLPVFDIDKDQIKRVCINLIENAVAAVEPVVLGSAQVDISTRYDNVLKIALMEIADNGHGVLPEVRDRIFEPYFSTKEQGTGLGLAIVKRIVDDHSGFIRVYKNTPKGTRFVVELPAITRTEIVSNRSSSQTSSKEGNANI